MSKEEMQKQKECRKRYQNTKKYTFCVYSIKDEQISFNI